jgi:acyl-CoA synthetase (AMP-forming)/AMP-acid ligase II
MSDEILRLYREVIAELTSQDAPFAMVDVHDEDPPVRLFAGTPADLPSVFDEVVARFGDRPLLTNENGQDHSYSDMFGDAARLGAALRSSHGVAAGDRVGLAMRNMREWFVAFIAVTRIGAVATLLNSRGAADELAAAIARVECRLVLTDSRCKERLAGQTDVPLIDPDGIAALIAAGGDDTAATIVAPLDPLAILFTSGTTGRPKGATVTQRNLCNMLRQIDYLGALGLNVASRRAGVPTEALVARMPVPTPLLIFPLFHISGLITFLSTIIAGGHIILMRRWEPMAALDLIERHRVTGVSGPSLVIADLLDLPGAAERMTSVGNVVVGGQASPLALCQRVREALPRATQGSGWGMTEVCGSITNASGALFDAFAGSVGLPLPVCDLKVAGADGELLPAGQVGELLVRGPMVMSGYWDDPKATAEAIRDGWLHTGDLGFMREDGLFFLVDRAKDMVISAGENIYCAEVERVLGAVPAHAEVSLFGVPDERLGERAIAAIVLRSDSDVPPDPEIVKAHARAALADYKVPAEVVFDLGPLPRNALGKVDKAQLRARYLSRLVAA